MQSKYWIGAIVLVLVGGLSTLTAETRIFLDGVESETYGSISTTGLTTFSGDGVRFNSPTAANNTDSYFTATHNATNGIFNNRKGGFQLATEAQKTIGRLTCVTNPTSGNIVIDNTTLTGGSEFAFGATLTATLENIRAAIVASGETVNTWITSSTTLDVQWAVAGTVGNAKTFTSTLDGTCTLTGSGTLGGTGATHVGTAARGALLTAAQSGMVTIGDAASVNYLPGPTNGDLAVTGRLDVKGGAWIEGTLRPYGGLTMASAFVQFIDYGGGTAQVEDNYILEETITIATGSSSALSSANLFAANMVVEGVQMSITQAPGGGATKINVGINGAGNDDCFYDDMTPLNVGKYWSVFNGDEIHKRTDGSVGLIRNLTAAKAVVTLDGAVTGASLILRLRVYGRRHVTT